ncbi:MAG: hypothetical protein ACRETM_09780 [Stenotrophobium sp.]
MAREGLSPAADADAPAPAGYLAHAGFRYLWLSVGLCLAALIAYLWSQPAEGANGGTWLGYTLGVIGVLLIAGLTLLGVRKRSYRSNLGSVRGWASAHVYLGLALTVVVTLHSGFHFGWNVHTLAYVLMLLVVASGVYGTIAYWRYPALIAANRDQGTREIWLAELDDINQQSLKLSDGLDANVHRVILASIDRIRIGGDVRAQLFEARTADRLGYERIERELTTTGRFTTQQLSPFLRTQTAASTVAFMAQEVVGGERQHAQAQKLLDLLTRRRDLVARINRDIRMHARMQIWLYLHVPLTFALLAALVAHIVCVFIYR